MAGGPPSETEVGSLKPDFRVLPHHKIKQSRKVRDVSPLSLSLCLLTNPRVTAPNSKVLEETVPPRNELGAVHIDARLIFIKEYTGIESVSIEAYVERIRVWSCLYIGMLQ